MFLALVESSYGEFDSREARRRSWKENSRFGVNATLAIRMVGRTSPFAAIDFHSTNSNEEKFFVFRLLLPLLTLSSL